MRRAIALAAPLALAAACVTLGPRPDPARYYVLEAAADGPNPARPPLPALGVGPVRLPAYLDRREIVTRAGATRLEMSSAERWAAPLDVLFRSVLAEDLRAAVPAREVLGWPWAVSASPEWAVSVDVLRFDREPDGTSVLEARWIVRRAGAAARQGVTTAREPSAAPETAATVAALSRTVGALARDVAAALQASRQEAPPGDGAAEEREPAAGAPRAREPSPGAGRPRGVEANGRAARGRAQAADSSTTEIPWPPPMHIVTRP